MTFMQLVRRGWMKGLAAGLASFAALGTVAALWPNPFFVRMTPSGALEIVLLAILSILAGLFVATMRPRCSVAIPGFGAVLGFLGISCPICNQLLLLFLSSELLLSYLEPIRPYVALLGIVILGYAIVREHRLRGEAPPRNDASPKAAPVQ